jgi:selenocysteine lyase/cysteine desulfurase
VQLGATYNVGKKSTDFYDQGVRAGATYVNAHPDEVVFGSSTTQLFRNLSIALDFPRDSEIIISKVDHEANIASWVQLAEWKNFTIKWWTATNPTNPVLDPAELQKLLTPRTRLVTCTHTSNILGTISDIKGIARMVHKVPDALLCVDGVAYAPHRPLDMKDLEVDFYSFSWYKVYGPHIAMLYASRDAQKHMISLGHYFKPSDTLEDKLGLAGANYECLQSIPRIVDYLEPQKWPGIIDHETKLQDLLLKYLRGKDGIQIYGIAGSDPGQRVPVISFTIAGRSSLSVIEAFEKRTGGNVGIRSGHFYSKRLINEVMKIEGEDGVVRVSMVHYNTEEEVNILIQNLDSVLNSPEE